MHGAGRRGRVRLQEQGQGGRLSLLSQAHRPKFPGMTLALALPRTGHLKTGGVTFLPSRWQAQELDTTEKRDAGSEN